MNEEGVRPLFQRQTRPRGEGEKAMSEIQAITMPKWGLAMEEGMVTEWLVELGEDVSAGQDVVEIETSKITNVFESPVAGPLRRQVVQTGETVPVSALLGVCAPPSVSDEEVDAFVTEFLDNFDWDAAGGATGPEPETVETDGWRLRYLQVGDGDGTPIVFIHGYGGDLNNWMFNQEALSDGRTSYAVDLPGHGGSTKDVRDGGLAELAAAVSTLLAAKEVNQAHLVGHSMGGAVSLHMALHQPDKVASATLIAPGGLGPDINMDYINGFIDQKRAKKLRAVMELLVADANAITSEMVEDVIKYKRLDGVSAALTTLRDKLFADGQQADSLRDGLGNAGPSIQVIWGRQDQIIPASHGEGLPDNIKVTIYEDAGHMPHMEKASEVNETISAFLD